MTMHLAMTAAGLAAIVDADNVATKAVKFTKLAIGTGTGSGDQSARTALMTQKMIAAVTGAASGNTRIAIRADFAPSESFAVTEAGLMAQIGDGAEFLAAYWVASSSAGALASAAADTALVVAGVISIESSNAAITVTPALNISVGVPDNVVLKTDHATETARGIVELATTAEAAAGTDTERAVTPAGLAGRTATTTRKGIVELATTTEARAGTDAVRVVTPAGLESRIGQIPAAASPPTATTTRKGIVELATTAEARAGTDAVRAVTPAGVKAVTDALGGGVAGAADAKTGNYSVVAGDDGKILEANANAAAFRIGLPDLGSGDDGFTVTVIKTDASANAVTVDGHGSDTINGSANLQLESRWEAAILKWTGSVWIAIGGVSSAFLRDFFGGASHREFTTAGAHSYKWEWDAPTGIAVLEGGGGGGGGGAASGDSGGYSGGDGGDHNMAGDDRRAGEGGGGNGGRDTTVRINGVTHTAEGGGGGGGATIHAQHGIGGDGGGQPDRGAPQTANTARRAAGGNASSAGGGGGAAGDRNEVNLGRAGSPGGAGELAVVVLTGLTKGDTFTCQVGGGGSGGRGGFARPFPDQPVSAGAGGGGDVGRVRLYPIF